jgi:hypothetical protein
VKGGDEIFAAVSGTGGSRLRDFVYPLHIIILFIRVSPKDVG